MVQTLKMKTSKIAMISSGALVVVMNESNQPHDDNEIIHECFREMRALRHLTVGR